MVDIPLIMSGTDGCRLGWMEVDGAEAGTTSKRVNTDRRHISDENHSHLYDGSESARAVEQAMFKFIEGCLGSASAGLILQVCVGLKPSSVY
jgi:hypothetical protein